MEQEFLKTYTQFGSWDYSESIHSPQHSVQLAWKLAWKAATEAQLESDAKLCEENTVCQSLSGKVSGRFLMPIDPDDVGIKHEGVIYAEAIRNNKE